MKDGINKIKEDLVRFKKYKVRTDIPEDLQVVIQTFIEATIMVGEKAADIIRGKEPLPPSNAKAYVAPNWETKQREGGY